MTIKINERVSLIKRKPEPSTSSSVEDRKERERKKRFEEEQKRSLKALRPEVPKAKVRTQSFDSNMPTSSQRQSFVPVAGNG